MCESKLIHRPQGHRKVTGRSYCRGWMEDIKIGHSNTGNMWDSDNGNLMGMLMVFQAMLLDNY